MGAWGLAAAWWALVWAAWRAAPGGGDEDAGPETLVWMAVLSVFVGAGAEWANARAGLWGWNGLPGNEFARYLAQGAAFAAYLPALDGLARRLGGTPKGHTAGPLAARTAAVCGLAVAAGAVAAGEMAALPPAAVLGMLALGLWLAADGANGLRGGPTLLTLRRSTAAWPAAGALLFAFDRAAAELSGAGRFAAAPDGLAPWEYAGLAFAGPAARALYVLAAGALDLPFAGRSPRRRALLG